MSIIDAHVHLDIKNYPDPAQAARNLVSVMDKANVMKAVIMPDGMDCSSESVKKAIMLYPDKLSGFYMPENFDKMVSGVELDGALKSGNYKGVKLHPRTQKIHIDDPKIENILKQCELLRTPVFIDCFPFGVLDQRNYPLAFDRIAKKMPSLVLIMGHMGGYRSLDAFVVAKSNKNVYLDLSFTFMYFRGSSVERDIRYILKKMAPDKLIYGSDYPQADMKDSADNILKLLRSLGLDKEAVDRIMTGNITSLLGLT